MFTVGHEREKEFLKKLHTLERIPNALAFIGKAGIGKKLLALEFARGLLCEENRPFGCGECKNCKAVNRFIDALREGEEERFAYYTEEDGKKRFSFYIGEHPDLVLLKPEKRQIRIDQIRDLQEYTALKPTGKYKVAILDDFESANLQAQNALLKTLEEPPKGVIFILISSKKGAVIPTILSRCQILEFKPLREREIEEILKGREVSPVLKELLLEEGSFEFLELPEGFEEFLNNVRNFERLTFEDTLKLSKDFESFEPEERGKVVQLIETLLFRKLKEGSLETETYEAALKILNEIERGLARGIKSSLAFEILLLTLKKEL